MVSLKIRDFWYMRPFNLVNIYQRFGDIFIIECGILYDIRGSIFFCNFCARLPDYTASHHQAWNNISTTPLFPLPFAFFYFFPLSPVSLYNFISFSFFVPFPSTFLMCFLLSVSLQPSASLACPSFLVTLIPLTCTFLLQIRWYSFTHIPF